MHYEDCTRCRTPKIEGHGVVCALTAVSEIAFWVGLLLLIAFWALLLRAFMAGPSPTDGIDGTSLFAINGGLFLILSLVTGTRARWQRHELVADLDAYLDEDGSCCGGACAGSCGDGACATDIPEADPTDMGDGGCCGGGRCG